MNSEHRKPVNLAQVDDYSCYTNVIAQVRWMFGTSDRIDSEAVREVDRRTGRSPGRPSSVQTQILLLARESYRIVSLEQKVSPERLRSEGVAYMKEICGRSWTEAYDAWWTPERIERYARKVDAFQRRFRRAFAQQIASGEMRLVYGWPRLRTVDRLLDTGYVVLATVANGSAPTSHAILIYGRAGRWYEVYEPYPDPKADTLHLWHRSDLNDVLLPDNGVIAVTRRPVRAVLAAAA